MTDPDFLHNPRPPAVDPAMRRIVLVAGGISVLVIAVALVGGSGRSVWSWGAPPVISPPAQPLRVAPVDPGGLVVPGGDEPIMSGQVSSAPPQLVTSGPAPDISQLAAAAGVSLGPPPAAAPGPSAPAAATIVSPPSALGASAVPLRVMAQLAVRPTAAAAQAVWDHLTQTVPGMVAGKTPLVAKVADGYRVQITGFADLGGARIFCAVLASQGESCVAGAF